MGEKKNVKKQPEARNCQSLAQAHKTSLKRRGAQREGTPKTALSRWLGENLFSPTLKNAPTQFQDAGTTPAMSQNVQTTPPGIHYAQYEPAKEAEYLPQIRQLISSDLSEPYSIYVYRYFLYQWADLCFMVNSEVHEFSE